eukprot:g2963.t1
MFVYMQGMIFLLLWGCTSQYLVRPEIEFATLLVTGAIYGVGRIFTTMATMETEYSVFLAFVIVAAAPNPLISVSEVSNLEKGVFRELLNIEIENLKLRKIAFRLEIEQLKVQTLVHRILPKEVATQLAKYVLMYIDIAHTCQCANPYTRTLTLTFTYSDEEVFFESHPSVTILFSDIVGFTQLCSKLSPVDISDFLNEVYTNFDKMIQAFQVHKVETIGDAYMVVSGCTQPIDYHARETVRVALALLDICRNIPVPSGEHYKHFRHDSRISDFDKKLFPSFISPNEDESVSKIQQQRKPHGGTNSKSISRTLFQKYLQIRIGIHSGPVVSGVVGITMPRWCLFGDTVNVASRMETTSESGQIHLSESTRRLLGSFCALCGDRGSHNFRPQGRKGPYQPCCYILKERGKIRIKGKGKMRTYFLGREEHFEMRKRRLRAEKAAQMEKERRREKLLMKSRTVSSPTNDDDAGNKTAAEGQGEIGGTLYRPKSIVRLNATPATQAAILSQPGMSHTMAEHNGIRNDIEGDEVKDDYGEL